MVIFTAENFFIGIIKAIGSSFARTIELAFSLKSNHPRWEKCLSAKSVWPKIAISIKIASARAFLARLIIAKRRSWKNTLYFWSCSFVLLSGIREHVSGPRSGSLVFSLHLFVLVSQFATFRFPLTRLAVRVNNAAARFFRQILRRFAMKTLQTETMQTESRLFLSSRSVFVIPRGRHFNRTN